MFGIYGYNSNAYDDKNIFLDFKNIEIVYFPVRDLGNLHHKIIPIDEIDEVDIDRILHINVYTKSYTDEE